VVLFGTRSRTASCRIGFSWSCLARAAGLHLAAVCVRARACATPTPMVVVTWPVVLMRLARSLSLSVRLAPHAQGAAGRDEEHRAGEARATAAEALRCENEALLERVARSAEQLAALEASQKAGSV
jgi:hypothetical protein